MRNVRVPTRVPTSEAQPIRSLAESQAPGQAPTQVGVKDQPTQLTQGQAQAQPQGAVDQAPVSNSVTSESGTTSFSPT